MANAHPEKGGPPVTDVRQGLEQMAGQLQDQDPAQTAGPTTIIAKGQTAQGQTTAHAQMAQDHHTKTAHVRMAQGQITAQGQMAQGHHTKTAHDRTAQGQTMAQGQTAHGHHTKTVHAQMAQGQTTARAQMALAAQVGQGDPVVHKWVVDVARVQAPQWAAEVRVARQDPAHPAAR